MAIELDHVIVTARDQVAAARMLADLLGVPWAAQTLGPFSAVYVNDGMTLDFIETTEPFPVEHFCLLEFTNAADLGSRICAMGII